ncbi:hypothetical protein D9M73_285240 [compost metagenome]
MPGQHAVAGGIQQQAEGGQRHRPWRGFGAAHQIAAFGQVMLDQARLVGVERTANAPAEPAPVFQVGQFAEDGFHEHHRRVTG